MLGAFTERFTALFLGERTLASFRDFGILPAFKGVVVSDRYQNYVRHEAHCYIAC